MGESRDLAKQTFWDNIIPSDSRINRGDSDDSIDAILDAACEETLGVMEAKLASFERRVISPLRNEIGETDAQLRGHAKLQAGKVEQKMLFEVGKLRAELDALKAGSPPSAEHEGAAKHSGFNPCQYGCNDASYCMEPKHCAAGSGYAWDKWAGWVKLELDGQTAWDALHPPSKRYNICVSPMYGERSKMVVGVVKDFATAKKIIDDMNMRKTPHSCVLIWTEPANGDTHPANNLMNDI